MNKLGKLAALGSTALTAIGASAAPASAEVKITQTPTVYNACVYTVTDGGKFVTAFAASCGKVTVA